MRVYTPPKQENLWIVKKKPNSQVFNFKSGQIQQAIKKANKTQVEKWRLESDMMFRDKDLLASQKHTPIREAKLTNCFHFNLTKTSYGSRYKPSQVKPNNDEMTIRPISYSDKRWSNSTANKPLIFNQDVSISKESPKTKPPWTEHKEVNMVKQRY